MSNQPEMMNPMNKKPMSTGKKVALGCLGTVVVVVALIAGGIWYAYSKITDLYQPYVDSGYVMVFEPIVVETETIGEPMLYVVQDVTIEADSAASLAFFSQMVKIKGVIHGDIDLIAIQDFVLEQGARINGDLKVKTAQRVTLKSGSVVTGSIQADALQMLMIEDGAIVGGTVTGTIQDLQQSPGALVGGGDAVSGGGSEEEDQDQDQGNDAGDDG